MIVLGVGSPFGQEISSAFKKDYLLQKVLTIFSGLSTLKLLSFFLRPWLWCQSRLKQRRSRKKGGVDYTRINRILLSKELLCGRHLIVQARKCEKNEAKTIPHC